MNDQPALNGSHHAMALPITHRAHGSENIAPLSRDKIMSSGHRPSRSQEEEQQRMRDGARLRGPPHGLDIFADPIDSGRYRRLRRNSESSIADKSGKISDLEDERRRRERRHRERDARHKGEVRRPQTAKPKKPSQRLDLIDQLDVTSIYGTGCMFSYNPDLVFKFGHQN